jgi:hypothetical protein
MPASSELSAVNMFPLVSLSRRVRSIFATKSLKLSLASNAVWSTTVGRDLEQYRGDWPVADIASMSAAAPAESRAYLVHPKPLHVPHRIRSSVILPTPEQAEHSFAV